MYERKYKLACEGDSKMERFRIVTTQGLPFSVLMKHYNIKVPGFIEAVDDYFDNTRWELTTRWESKDAWLNAQKHPMAKIFWNRFEMEAFKHELNFIAICGDTGETYEPLKID
jgi:hypothetical protein